MTLPCVQCPFGGDRVIRHSTFPSANPYRTWHRLF